MAEDTVNTAIKHGLLETRPCKTRELKLHGWSDTAGNNDEFPGYGVDSLEIKKLIKNDASLAEKIHGSLPYTKAEILWSVQNEMCMTVEDALARRTRALFLDAQAATDAAPIVASILAREMKKDFNWQQNQIDSFLKVAATYLPVNYNLKNKL